MYDAKEAKEDCEIAVGNRFRDYWRYGNIKSYGVEKLIKEASLRGECHISMVFVLFRDGNHLYLDTWAGSDSKFKDFVDCLRHYGYKVYDCPHYEDVYHSDPIKATITIGW